MNRWKFPRFRRFTFPEETRGTDVEFLVFFKAKTQANFYKSLFLAPVFLLMCKSFFQTHRNQVSAVVLWYYIISETRETRCKHGFNNLWFNNLCFVPGVRTSRSTPRSRCFPSSMEPGKKYEFCHIWAIRTRRDISSYFLKDEWVVWDGRHSTSTRPEEWEKPPPLQKSHFSATSMDTHCMAAHTRRPHTVTIISHLTECLLFLLLVLFLHTNHHQWINKKYNKRRRRRRLGTRR